MHRAKSRGRSQQHHIHAAINDLLVRIQAHEALVRCHLDPLRVTLLHAVLLQGRQARLNLFLEGIAHRSEDDVFVRVERLARGARAATPTTDEATRNVSPLAPAKRLPGRMAGAASAPPMAAEVLRNSRRVVRLSWLFMIEVFSPVLRPFERGVKEWWRMAMSDYGTPRLATTFREATAFTEKRNREPDGSRILMQRASHDSILDSRRSRVLNCADGRAGVRRTVPQLKNQ
jgi:hypothetical protein